MFSLSKALFLFAASLLVTAAPVPNLNGRIPVEDSVFVNYDSSDFKRSDVEGSVLVNYDSADFKRQELEVPPGFQPLQDTDKELLNFDTTDFKRDVELPAGFGNEKELLNFDSTDF